MNSWCLRSRLNDAIIIGQVTPPAIQQARDGCCGFARAAAARQPQSSFVFSPHGRSMKQQRVVTSERVPPVEEQEKRSCPLIEGNPGVILRPPYRDPAIRVI